MQMMITTQYLETLKDFSHHKSILVPHHHAASDSAMLSEVSLTEAPPQMLAMEDEVEAVEGLPNAGKKKGKMVRKKKRRVKTGPALCDCDGENQEYDQAEQAEQAEQADQV
eukprot:s151_g17.t1